ncbi:hypothetical protein [Formosa haliotis]|uniref:hypothetical protein n=1 Tax=Formosa haliotis TaxID=1555194 RepID=UPI000AAC429D|nr:hypothetical protein [Formosa haliotis]
MIQNILFTCAGRRNYLINYFKEALNGNGLIYAADISTQAPAMSDADVAIEVPSIYSENYIPELLKIIDQFKITAIISLNDLELPILSKHFEAFKNRQVALIVSNERVINISCDKWETYNFFIKHDIPTPKTYLTIDDALDGINQDELLFPVVIKPRWGSASIGIDFAESIEEMKLAYALQKIKLKKSILNTASEADFDHAILIQEKLKALNME